MSKRIVLVDDDPVLLALSESILTTEYEVHAFGNAEDALFAVSADVPDDFLLKPYRTEEMLSVARELISIRSHEARMNLNAMGQQLLLAQQGPIDAHAPDSLTGLPSRYATVGDIRNALTPEAHQIELKREFANFLRKGTVTTLFPQENMLPRNTFYLSHCFAMKILPQPTRLRQ